MNRGKEDIIYGLPPFYQQPDYPDYPRVFFQNGENIVVKSKTRGIIEGQHIQRVPIVGAEQIAVVIGPGKEYSQLLTISRYFDFKPDVYEIYLENAMTEEKLKISGVNWTGELTSNTITIEVVEKKDQAIKGFEGKVNQVMTGMSREQVTTLLGKPSKKQVAILPKPPFWGPQESLVNIISPGSEYEEWEYEVNNRTYLIFFGSVATRPETDWKVIDKTSFPKGAVF